MPFDEADEDLSTDRKFEACRKDLRLVGLVASIDPDRDGVPESVIAARGAGIRVVMITGNYLKTAVAIARNVTILQPQDDEPRRQRRHGWIRHHGEHRRVQLRTLACTDPCQEQRFRWQVRRASGLAGLALSRPKHALMFLAGTFVRMGKIR